MKTARGDRSHLRYPSDLADDEWKLVETLIPPGRRGGDKRTVIMILVVNGLMYILSRGGPFRKICCRARRCTTISTPGVGITLDLIQHELYVKSA
jgi:hypothetical protein